MTTVVDDPLIASMVISRMLPLHESSRRLRELYPECPRVYGVAVMGDLIQTSLVAAVRGARRPIGCDVMFDAAAPRPTAAWRSPNSWPPRCRTSSSGGSFRCSSLEGRAWDTGAGEPLGACRLRGRDRLGRRLRPDAARAAGGPVLQRPLGTAAPPCRQGSHRRAAQRGGADDVGGAPQPPRPGSAVRQAARDQRRRRDRPAMWHIVGAAVVSAATQVPLLAGSSEVTSMRRAQAVLDALVGFGAPVRGHSRGCGRRSC